MSNTLCHSNEATDVRRNDDHAVRNRVDNLCGSRIRGDNEIAVGFGYVFRRVSSRIVHIERRVYPLCVMFSRRTRWVLSLCALGTVVLLAALYASRDVAVEDPLVEWRTRIITCIESGERSWRGTCFREIATEMRAQHAFPDILAMLAKLDDESPVKESCHALMHYIGQDEYAATGDLPTTFARCATQIACGEGCFHGAVEGYMMDTGDIAAEFLPALCDKSFTLTQTNHDACTHGIGHALMLVHRGDIMPSLERCDALTEERAREFCYAGVFMENVFGYGSPFHPSRFLDPERPAYPCTVLPERYGDMCYESQSSYVFNYLGGPDKAAAFCATVPEAHQTTCYGNIGGDVVVGTASPGAVRAACSLAPEGVARERCYQQALVFRLHMTSGDVRALRPLCDAADATVQTSCDETAGVTIEDWYPGEREVRCTEAYADVPERFALCVGT